MYTLNRKTILVAVGVVTVISGMILYKKAIGQGGSVSPPAKSRTAVEPIAPTLSTELVSLLQDGSYPRATTLLKSLVEKETDESRKSFYNLLLGVTTKLSGQSAEARAVFKSAIDASPKGVWAGKLRFELASLELLANKPAEAESLARAQVEILLAPGRKDHLASIVREFALGLLSPPDSLTPADPNSAHDLLAQARELSKGDELAGKLLFEMAKASRQANNHPRAIEEIQSYLKTYDKGADRNEARFLLADSQLAVGQNVLARMTWADLARDLEGKPGATLRDLRARSLFQISRTHFLPNPPDDAQLNLGVAALERFLDDSPDHPLAVRAAYELAVAPLSRGKSEQALAAFRAFVAGDRFKAVGDDAKKELLDLRMTATFQIAQILQGQQKFEEAISAWKGYLAQYPNGPNSADSQRSIVDTEYLIAATHFNRKEYAQARAAWNSFAAKNPLDGRVPQALFDIGSTFYQEKKYDEAIAAWQLLEGKFPGSEPAAHAQFSIASTMENQKGDLPGAIERYRKVLVEPWASQARMRIAVMEAKALAVVTPKAFRSGETPFLKVNTRNLEKLTFSAYKLDAEAYFRKKLHLENVESLDIGLVAPDAEWVEEIPGQAKYKPVDHDYPLKRLEGQGVWVVKVGDERNLQAATLVIASDVDAIIKTSRDQLLVFAQDMKTGKGRPNARVLVSNRSEVVLESKTGADGVLLHTWDKPRDPGAGQYRVLVLDGENVAGTGLSVPGKVAEGLAARAYVLTDRPAYRPGQQVEVKGIVRSVKNGQYASPARELYKVNVIDSKGRLILNKEVRLTDFGTFNVHLDLEPTSPLGDYRVTVSGPHFNDASGSFQVQTYQLEKIDLKFDIPKSVVFRGDKVELDVVAKYQYGTPLAGRDIEVAMPDGRTLHGATDAAGKYHVSLETNGFAEEQPLGFTARLPRDNVAASGVVMLAVRGFSIGLSTNREVYLDGETFPLKTETTDAAGKPVGKKLSAAVFKRITESGRVTEREVSRVDVTTDPKTGKATTPIKVDDPLGGSFVVRSSGVDQFGNPIVAERTFTISGKNDPARVRILTDRTTFRSGETAKVDLHVRDKGGTALLTWEGDKILSYKIITIREGANPLEWTVDAAQFPNFTLAAARMADARLDSATLDVRVERELKVSLKPSKNEVAPGEEVDVEVTATDQLDRPVAAELAIVLVDRALLRLFEAQNGSRASLAQVFYNQTRTGSFATESTNTFSYHAATSHVPNAIVEEADRLAAAAADKEVEEKMKKLADLGVENTVVAQLRTMDGADQKNGGGPGGLGGGMGGMGGANGFGLNAPAASAPAPAGMAKSAASSFGRRKAGASRPSDSKKDSSKGEAVEMEFAERDEAWRASATRPARTPQPDNGSSRPLIGTPASSPAPTARPRSASRRPPRFRTIASTPGASQAKRRSSVRPRRSSPCASLFWSISKYRRSSLKAISQGSWPRSITRGPLARSSLCSKFMQARVKMSSQRPSN